MTLDLNGFIVSIGLGATGGVGIDAPGQTNLRLQNGTVEGFGGHGVVTGDRARIENVTVIVEVVPDHGAQLIAHCARLDATTGRAVAESRAISSSSAPVQGSTHRAGAR